MGLEIKRNEEGLYNLKSTVSGESYHPKQEWITEDEAKKILIEDEFWKFLENCVKIDMSFPNRYNVNDKREFDHSKPDFNKWMSEVGLKDNGENLCKKFEEIRVKLNLGFNVT